MFSKKNRSLCLLLTCSLLFSVLPGTSLAVDPEDLLNNRKNATLEAIGYMDLYDGTTHDAFLDIILKDENGERMPTTDWTILYDGEQNMPRFTDAGTYIVSVSASHPNYRPLSTSVTVSIKPRHLTLTSASKSKPFDGSPLTDNSVTVSGDGFVPGEVCDLKAVGTITKAGKTTNTIQFTKNPSFKDDNYRIIKKEGTLEVKNDTRPVITISAKNASKTYDGTPMTAGFTTSGTLRDGDTMKVTMKGSQTDAGSSKSTVDAVIIYDADGTDISKQYIIKKTDGTLTVKKRKVTLTSASDSQEYTGKALTNHTVTVGERRFVDGQGATCQVTGSQTDIGTSENTFTYTLNKNTKEENYEIQVIFGTLCVKQSISSNINPHVPEMLNGEEHFAYIIGYADGKIYPEANITRAEVATLFFRLLNSGIREKNQTKTNQFSDVQSTDWFCKAVSTMSNLNVLNGYGDGTFAPNKPITRAEFATMIARIAQFSSESRIRFSDTDSHWAAKFIHQAATFGWINGYADGSFRPDQAITRAEAMALTNRVLNRIPEKDSDLFPDMHTWSDNADPCAWYYLSIQEATNSHKYTRKENGYETWREKMETPDWSVLERSAEQKIF